MSSDRQASAPSCMESAAGSLGSSCAASKAILSVSESLGREPESPSASSCPFGSSPGPPRREDRFGPEWYFPSLESVSALPELVSGLLWAGYLCPHSRACWGLLPSIPWRTEEVGSRGLPCSPPLAVRTEETEQEVPAATTPQAPQP